MPPDQFRDWLFSRKGPRSVVYYKGFLLLDRLKDREVDRFASFVWKARLRDMCYLVQRKLGPGVYEYLAVKRR